MTFAESAETSGWGLGPPDPTPATHPFVPFRYGDRMICAEVVNGGCCGRSEDEHPAAEGIQAEE